MEAKSPVPRLIAANIPLGDPGFVTRVVFRIAGEVDGGANMSFRVVEHEPEGPRDAYVAWAKKRIAELGLEWPVLVTP